MSETENSLLGPEIMFIISTHISLAKTRCLVIQQAGLETSLTGQLLLRANYTMEEIMKFWWTLAIRVTVVMMKLGDARNVGQKGIAVPALEMSTRADGWTRGDTINAGMAGRPGCNRPCRSWASGCRNDQACGHRNDQALGMQQGWRECQWVRMTPSHPYSMMSTILRCQNLSQRSTANFMVFKEVTSYLSQGTSEDTTFFFLPQSSTQVMVISQASVNVPTRNADALLEISV